MTDAGYDFAVFNNWFFGDTSNTENRNFREVDNRREEHAASGADVRDRDRAAFKLSSGQLAVASANSQITDGISDIPNVFAVSILDNRNDQAVVCICSNTDIVVFL